MPVTLHRPIIIVGTHRSGTSFLGHVFDRHPDVAYWEEPRHVWVRGNANTPDDVLGAEGARAGVVSKIHKAFDAYMRKHGGSRFAEKTPSNCLRLDFIEAVFPDARYIHIYRDGRAVVCSTKEMVHTGTPEARWVVQRLLGTPPTEWPSLASRLMLTIGSKLRGKGMSFWGPRPRGWKEWMSEPEVVKLSRQWRGTIEPVLDFRERVDPARWFEISYEDFVSDPESRVREMFDAAGVNQDAGTLEWVRERADPSRQEKWRERLSEEELGQMRPILEETLGRLGYGW